MVVVKVDGRLVEIQIRTEPSKIDGLRSLSDSLITGDAIFGTVPILMTPAGDRSAPLPGWKFVDGPYVG